MPRRRARRSRKRSLTSHEKGHLFEDVVVRYFKLLGYSVEKNVRVRGLSGAVHEVDVLISRDGAKSVVEAKNYSKSIPKEWVMKASNVAKDVGATEVYVVSTSGFTPDAVKVADVLGVKLLSLDDMVRELRRAMDSATLMMHYVRPRFKKRTTKEEALKYVVKKFFRPIEEVYEAELVYYPFYAFSVEYVYVEETGLLSRREIEKRTRFTILVNAVYPTVPVVKEGSLTLTELTPVTNDEAELLEVLSGGEKPLSISDLEDRLGWSRQKISRLLSKLEERGLIEYEEEKSNTGRTINVYYSTVPSIDELNEASKLLVPDDGWLEQGKPKDSAVEPRISSVNVVATINGLYTSLRIHERKLIYIPIYRVKMCSTEDDTYRYIFFVASTDKPILMENLEEES
ncbi:MAG: restriction endonuclease [Desulfurococcaceae archaeon]